MSYDLTQKVRVIMPHANIDELYGTYNSIAEALAAVPTALRQIGRTVGIIEGGQVVEYWFQRGIANAQLVPKNITPGITGKVLQPTDPTPTIDGLYKPSEVGVYANAGGLEALAGYDTVFQLFEGVWSKAQVELPMQELIYEGHITPTAPVLVTAAAGNITIEIPVNTRITGYGYQYLKAAATTLTETMTSISYLVWNKTLNDFDIVAYNEVTDTMLVIGFLNPYDQKFFINSGYTRINGVDQEFRAPLTPATTFNETAFASQKMATITSNLGVFWKKNINLLSAFPFNAIKSIKVLKCDNLEDAFFNSGVLKTINFTTLRVQGIAESATTLVYFTDENNNAWATFNSTTKPVTNIMTVIATNNTWGLEVEVIIDTTLVTGQYSVPPSQGNLNTETLYNQANNNIISSGLIPKNYGIFLNPKATDFNYNAIISLRMLSGNYLDFYNVDGSLKELFLTFFRINKGTGTTNIIEVAWKDGATVGIGNKTFITIAGDTRDLTGARQTEFILSNSAGTIKASMIVDVSKLTPSYVGSASIGDKLQLNSLLLVNQLKEKNRPSTPLAGKRVVCIGDSVTEFGNYPQLIESITGASVAKVGFGGCRMGKRVGTSAGILAYDELAMYKIANSIATGDYTAMGDAVVYLRDNSGDNNTLAFDTLVATDFNEVDIVTIFFGTNDFTSDENPLGTKESVDPLELRGAVNIVVNKLLTAYPHLKLLFISPTHRFFGTGSTKDSDIEANGLGLYLKEYSDAIIDQANENHIPALDLYRTSGFNKENHFYYFGTDGVHPNALGYKHLAERISAFINSTYIF